MIYFDNSSTTLIKPKIVADSVKYAINNFGNSGRSYNECAILSARSIYNTREAIANLINLDNPLNIAFTSGATESLNLVINSVLEKTDHVIMSAFDHNSSIRPLYNLGCKTSIIPILNGKLNYKYMNIFLTSQTKAVICTHASNVTGEIIDPYIIKEFCKKNNLIFILDVSQTLGSVKVDASMADIICFTGHKSLFGPQGTGGIILNENIKIKHIVKTGGTGINTYDYLQQLQMPDIYEAGTLNSHSLYGLLHSVNFINNIGIQTISEHKNKLIKIFLDELKHTSGINLYSNFKNNVGIIALNYKDIPSDILAKKLYEDYEIFTRAQSHCAPLLHTSYNTKLQGMVRFSFSYFNTVNEVKSCTNAIKEIIQTL
ncbi:MAG: aminotransferase class V-fold PLP-dependent enzyme [Bacilli bacterium]